MSGRYLMSLLWSLAIADLVTSVPTAHAQSLLSHRCAAADLALISKLDDFSSPTDASPGRMAGASKLMVDARAACRSGNEDAGLTLYAEAEKLATPRSLLQDSR